MFADQLRRAVEASPRVELARVAQLLWRAYGAGHVSEAEASALSEAIEARRALPAPQKPVQRRSGSRPRSGASMERRRRSAASGCLPPQIAARFTLAETAVLAVIAAEHVKHGRCTLAIDHIAALAGVGRTTVKNALREAQRQDLARIEERRVSAWRNAPNIVTITSREWTSWLRMRRRGVGSNPQLPRIQESSMKQGRIGSAGSRAGFIRSGSGPARWATKQRAPGPSGPWRNRGCFGCPGSNLYAGSLATLLHGSGRWRPGPG